MNPTQILTPSERTNLEQIKDRIKQIRDFFLATDTPKRDDPLSWYEYLNKLKNIQGNPNNDISFIATLMAKDYLVTKYGIQGFDAAAKAQGAPGFDIDFTFQNGDRIVAEIKTTIPYKITDFGAQQKDKILIDIYKLTHVEAKYKFLMVTEKSSFEILKKPKYCSQLSGLKIVNLPTGEEFEVLC